MTELVDSNLIPCDSFFAQFSGIREYDFLKFIKQIWSNKSGRKKKITEKNPRQITAQARLPQVTTSARKLSVGKYLYLALTKTMATDWSSIPLNKFYKQNCPN